MLREADVVKDTVSDTETHELVHDEWMSESDALIFRIERNPLLRSTIVGVWVLDELPPRWRMDRAIDRALERLPRMRQRVVDDAVTTPRWVDDEYFELDAHYSWARLPGEKARRRDVLEYAQRLGDRAFDKDRPLWELVVIEGMTKGRAAIVMKVHHAIADGLGMVEMLAHMVDLDASGAGHEDHDDEAAAELERARASAGRRPARSLLHRAATEAATGRRMGEATLRAAAELARDPIGSIQQFGRTTGSVARIVKPTTTPLSPLMTGRSMTGRFDVLRCPLSDLRRAAKAVDSTVNDAFIAFVLDGLWRYHDALGASCDRLRLNMPISVRTADETGDATNHFVPTRMEIDVGAAEPLMRVESVRARLRAARDEPALPYVNDISAAIGRLGQAASVSLLGSMMLGCDVTASNVPGPLFPVWMAGSRIAQFYAFGPPAGSALNVTLFSYDHTVHVALHTDVAAVIDGDLLVESTAAAIDELIDAAR